MGRPGWRSWSVVRHGCRRSSAGASGTRRDQRAGRGSESRRARRSYRLVARQISVASVSKPIGASRRVAGSSLTAVRNTSAAPASTPRARERRGDRAQHRERRAPERSRGLLDVRVDLQQRRAGRADRLRQEQHDVGEHEHRERLVERQRHARVPRNTSASATTMPGSAWPAKRDALDQRAEAARVAGGQQRDRQRAGGGRRPPRAPAAEQRVAAPRGRRRPSRPRRPRSASTSRRARRPAGRARRSATSRARSASAGQRQRPSRTRRGRRCGAGRDAVVGDARGACAPRATAPRTSPRRAGTPAPRRPRGRTTSGRWCR